MQIEKRLGVWLVCCLAEWYRVYRKDGLCIPNL